MKSTYKSLQKDIVSKKIVLKVIKEKKKQLKYDEKNDKNQAKR